MSKMILLTLLLTTGLMAKAPEMVPDDRLKIYVVDTGIVFDDALSKFKCETGHRNFTTSLFHHPHGTIMAKLIVKDLDHTKWCIVDVKWYVRNSDSTPSYLNAIEYVSKQTPSFVNLSVSGTNSYHRELTALNKMVKDNFKLSIAAGNEHKDLSKKCIIYPACYFLKKHKNVKVSSSYLTNTANLNGPVTNMDESIGGTSLSAARTTNKWVRNAK